jgi:hypothetical protein
VQVTLELVTSSFGFISFHIDRYHLSNSRGKFVCLVEVFFLKIFIFVDDDNNNNSDMKRKVAKGCY